LLSFVGWCYRQSFPVFCNSAASDLDALISQDIRNLVIAKWFARIFRCYQFLDNRADGGG
jgi:hypothetical protein